VLSQGITNNGAVIIIGSGASVQINGNYLNESSGSVILNGVIKLTGDWINNGSGNIISNPGTNGEVIFEGSSTQHINGSTTNYFAFNQLTINNGSQVVVDSGMDVTAYGTTTLNGPECLVLESGMNPHPMSASFIDNGTISGPGTMVDKCYTTGTGTYPVPSGRGWYLASPVANTKSSVFGIPAETDNDLWYWNDITVAWVTITTNNTPINPMQGYSFRSDSNKTLYFTGSPNTGNYSISNIPGASEGYYLLGNPYPSSVNWNDAITTNINNTISYRTVNSSNTMVFDTWNGLVGTDNNGYAAVNGYIPPMQSVWISVTESNLIGSVLFTNDMRLHNNSMSGFLKSDIQDSLDVFRLTLSGNGQVDQNIILQKDFASDSMDAYDSQKMFLSNSSVGELYTLSAEGTKLVINTVPPIANSDKQFAVGLNIASAGKYSLSADLSQLLYQGNVYLEDKKLNIIQDLRIKSEYSFSSPVVSDTGRFVILFKSLSVGSASGLNSLNSTTTSTSSYTYSNEAQIYVINYPVGSNINVYDLSGRLIYSGICNSDQDCLDHHFNVGCYIVKVSNNSSTASEIVTIRY